VPSTVQLFEAFSLVTMVSRKWEKGVMGVREKFLLSKIFQGYLAIAVADSRVVK